VAQEGEGSGGAAVGGAGGGGMGSRVAAVQWQAQESLDLKAPQDPQDLDLKILKQRLQLVASQRQLAALHCECFARTLETDLGALRLREEGAGEGQQQGEVAGAREQPRVQRTWTRS